MRISTIIREMLEKIRERNKSRKVFTSTQQSNNKHHDKYGTMHEYDLGIHQYMLYLIVFPASNNVETLYYHKDMKTTDAKYFQKAIIN